MEKTVVTVLSIIFIGALLVLIITHAGAFATAVAAGGTFVDNSALVLTGNSPTSLGTYPS